MPIARAREMASRTLAGSFGETAMPSGFLASTDSKIATWAAASSVGGPRNSAVTPSSLAADSMPLRASTQYGLSSDLGRKTYDPVGFASPPDEPAAGLSVAPSPQADSESAATASAAPTLSVNCMRLSPRVCWWWVVRGPGITGPAQVGGRCVGG